MKPDKFSQNEYLFRWKVTYISVPLSLFYKWQPHWTASMMRLSALDGDVWEMFSLPTKLPPSRQRLLQNNGEKLNISTASEWFHNMTRWICPCFDEVGQRTYLEDVDCVHSEWGSRLAQASMKGYNISNQNDESPTKMIWWEGELALSRLLFGFEQPSTGE